MKAILVPIIGLLIVPSYAANGQERPNAAGIAATLKQLSPHVVPESEREQLRTMIGRRLREQIAESNRRSTAAWAQISSREEWEAFRREKLAALRKSLGELPPRPAVPRRFVTGRIQGDGFQIHNLV